MKYTSEKIREICKYLRVGNTQKDSAVLAGVAESTFYKWMGNVEFSEPIKKAEYECKARNIAIIQNAAEKSWQAAAWWLERKYPDEFAIKTVLEHTGKNGGEILINLNTKHENSGISRTSQLPA